MQPTHDFTTFVNAGLTQGEFARLTGVSRPTVNLWLSGRKHPRATSRAVLDRLLPVLKRVEKKGGLHGLRGQRREAALQAIAELLRASW